MIEGKQLECIIENFSGIAARTPRRAFHGYLTAKDLFPARPRPHEIQLVQARVAWQTMLP